MLSKTTKKYQDQAKILLKKNKLKFYFTDEGGEISVDNQTMGDDNIPIWNFTERYSVDSDGKLLGYFQAHIKRPENFVENILIFNFGTINYTFSKDYKEFWTGFFDEHKFKKIRFNVIIGNPAEKQYDKLVKKYGGCVIGTFKNEVLFNDGTYKDVKIYELYKENYDKIRKSQK